MLLLQTIFFPLNFSVKYNHNFLLLWHMTLISMKHDKMTRKARNCQNSYLNNTELNISLLRMQQLVHILYHWQKISSMNEKFQWCHLISCKQSEYHENLTEISAWFHSDTRCIFYRIRRQILYTCTKKMFVLTKISHLSLLQDVKNNLYVFNNWKWSLIQAPLSFMIA